MRMRVRSHRGGTVGTASKTMLGIFILFFGIMFTFVTYSIFSTSSSISDGSFYEEEVKDFVGEDVVIIGGQTSFEQDEDITEAFSMFSLIFVVVGAAICLLGIVFIIKGVAEKKRNNNNMPIDNNFGNSNTYYQENTYNLNGEIYKRDKNSLDL